ncbi:MAG: class I SAM-dependent methyltransferase [Proteobacteria bacterium]|nr:class I SAM-dependent methyltransferase [Pseudomonadota bacterium]
MRTIIYPLTLQTKYYHKIINMAEIKNGFRILDIGCGTGMLGILLKTLYGSSIEYFAVDPNKYVVKAAQIKADKNNYNFKILRGKIENMPFKDKSFDLIFCNLVVHHLPLNIFKTGLSEIRRVLKSKANLLIFDYCPTHSFVHYIVYLITYVWTSIHEHGKDLFKGRMPIHLEKEFSDINVFQISKLFPLAIYRAKNDSIK